MLNINTNKYAQWLCNYELAIHGFNPLVASYENKVDFFF